MVPVKRFLAAAAVCVMLGGCASAGPENRELPGSPASEPVSAPEPVSRQVTLVAAGTTCPRCDLDAGVPACRRQWL